MSTSDIQRQDVYKNIEEEIISRFLDCNTGYDAPFSIHEVTSLGSELFQKDVGDWYGTNSISQVLKELNKKYQPYKDFDIIIFNDGVVFKEDIIKAGSKIVVEDSKSGSQNSSLNDGYFEETRINQAQSGGSDDFKSSCFKGKWKHSGGHSFKEERKSFSDDLNSSNNSFSFKGTKRKWNKSILIIVNVRLGLKKIPEESYSEISNIFTIPQTIGMIGGKGKFGLYFVGAQKENLILLDPHISQ